MSAAVDLFARLIISNGSDTISVEAERSQIRVEFKTLGTAIDLANQNAHLRSWRTRLRWLHAACQAAGLDVCVRLAGRRVARLGTHARPGLTSRLLGLGSVELHPLQTGLAWWQRKR